MKIHELAKKLGVKHTELIPFLQKMGYDYKGFSAEILDHELEKIEELSTMWAEQKKEEDNFFEENNKANFIGTYYNPETKLYEVYSMEVNPEELAKLNKTLHGEFSTVWKTKPLLGILLNQKGLMKPNPIDMKRIKGK